MNCPQYALKTDLASRLEETSGLGDVREVPEYVCYCSDDMLKCSEEYKIEKSYFFDKTLPHVRHCQLVGISVFFLFV